jgi:hypothetical protein
MGTGTYIATVKLLKRVSNILPMFGQKVIIKYDGYSKICKNCYQYHKEADCVKRSWQEFVVQFKDENPGVPQDWYDVHEESKEETHEVDSERGLNMTKELNLLANESGTLEEKHGDQDLDQVNESKEGKRAERDDNNEAQVASGHDQYNIEVEVEVKDLDPDRVHDVNTYFSNDEIILFIKENELSESEINWLKSLRPKSEIEMIDLIGSIMHERTNKQPTNETKTDN